MNLGRVGPAYNPLTKVDRAEVLVVLVAAQSPAPLVLDCKLIAWVIKSRSHCGFGRLVGQSGFGEGIAVEFGPVEVGAWEVTEADDGLSSNRVKDE